MKKRIAKKIERNVTYRGAHSRYTLARRIEALLVIRRAHWREMRRHNDGDWHGTKGWRFGKWDPQPSMNPHEPPF